MLKNSENRKRTAPIGLLLFVLFFLLCGCEAGLVPRFPAEATIDTFAMDTTLTIRAYGVSRDVPEAAERLVRTMEERLSVTIETSDVAVLNRDGAVNADPVTAELLAETLALCDETRGALDVTVYPVLRAWGFTTGENRVPDPSEIASLLETVDYRTVSVGGEAVSVPDGVMVDLGSVAKGYACDRMREVLAEGGAASALIDFGGKICEIGSKPDGSAWQIGIRDPGRNGLTGALKVTDEYVVTSGGYERFFEDPDGNIWWHILDPATGYPARNGLLSVTIVGTKGVRCDALSTALFVMGTEKAVAFWREKGDFEMILVTDDGRLLLTSGLKERFTPAPEASYTVETVERTK